MHSLHPELVPCICSFIEQNSSAAHLRRRNDTMYTNGVRLKDICAHIKKTLGISVCKDTVHRLLLPPWKKTLQARRYKGLISARVPPKRNTKEKITHTDFHYTCCQVNLINEMAFMCEKNTLALSVDNKNKVEVGIPATSRCSKIRTFYMIEESPNYNDHDFPHSNAKLVPAGYQILWNKMTRSRSLSPKRKFPSLRRRSLSEGSGIEQKLKSRLEFCQDKIGRNKIKWPHSGPLNVKLYLY